LKQVGCCSRHHNAAAFTVHLKASTLASTESFYSSAHVS